MFTFRDIRQASLAGPTALAIGNFDGLHLGHQMLLQELRATAVTLAATYGTRAQTALITFDPHPLSILRRDEPNLVLTTARERLSLAAMLGIDVGVIQPFTMEIAQMEPVTFVQLLKRHLGLAALVVGPDFALGRGRAGNITLLRSLGAELDFTVHVIQPVATEGQSVRSSIVRELLLGGNVAAATPLLSRPYRVSGIVEAGDQRGRTVGIPTANIGVPAHKLLPANGVYVTRAWIASFDRVHAFPSVTNVGVRPTVDGQHRRVEAHLLDFPPPHQIDDLYGETVAVDFLERVRSEQRFAGVDALVAQIRRDIEHARRYFAAHGMQV